MGLDGENGGIPRVVRDCIQFLRESGGSSHIKYCSLVSDQITIGMTEEGLFRRSPNSVLLRQVQEAYDRGMPLL